MTVKITAKQLKDISIENTIENTSLLIDFLMILAHEIGLKTDDILEFFKINSERNPKILQAREIASYYAFLNDSEKEELKKTTSEQNLNFELIEKYSLEFLEKVERQRQAPERLLVFISSIKKDGHIFQKLIDLFHESVRLNNQEIPKEVFVKTSPVLLIEIFRKLVAMPDSEASQAFFLIQFLKAKLRDIPFLSFI